MTRDEFLKLKAGDLIGWTCAGYTRVYDVLAAPAKKVKGGYVLRARCRFYGDHEFTFEDVASWTKR